MAIFVFFFHCCLEQFFDIIRLAVVSLSHYFPKIYSYCVPPHPSGGGGRSFHPLFFVRVRFGYLCSGIALSRLVLPPFENKGWARGLGTPSSCIFYQFPKFSRRPQNNQTDRCKKSSIRTVRDSQGSNVSSPDSSAPQVELPALVAAVKAGIAPFPGLFGKVSKP